MSFQDEIQSFIDLQLNAIRSASTDVECQECIQNIKQEHENLNRQNQMLRSGQAAIHAAVEVVKNGDVWGYIVQGVGIVLSGIQVVAGFGVGLASLATGNVIGVAFGAMLTLHGFNGMQEGVENLVYGRDDSEGFLKTGYVVSARFLGFDKKVGEIAYSSMDLGLSAYGIFKLSLKPDAWRLFRYVNSDYARGFRTMTSTELGIEVYNDANAIKSIYDSSRAK